jgi:hypothetical protein
MNKFSKQIKDIRKVSDCTLSDSPIKMKALERRKCVAAI